MTTKANALEELKGMHPTKVVRSKPNAQDIGNWGEETAKIASSIKLNQFPGQ